MSVLIDQHLQNALLATHRLQDALLGAQLEEALAAISEANMNASDISNNDPNPTPEHLAMRVSEIESKLKFIEEFYGVKYE